MIAEGEREALLEKTRKPVYEAAMREYERLRAMDTGSLMNQDAARRLLFQVQNTTFLVTQ